MRRFFVSFVSFVAVQLRSFDVFPFLLDRKFRHLIGSKNGTSLAVKIIVEGRKRALVPVQVLAVAVATSSTTNYSCFYMMGGEEKAWAVF
ncbi:hypothetical protein KFK09_026833 [Dendrobium nobile]|uniref:Uncharacterized protein n=1 Tax=Dendrobium nobile TaxID=94219 RepID=A0A8T3A8M9_DENNO|nr:hypothetical protein KFK09_026833 [Dendrobium nobile]